MAPSSAADECSNSWTNRNYLLPVDHITRHKKVSFRLIRFRDPSVFINLPLFVYANLRGV